MPSRQQYIERILDSSRVIKRRTMASMSSEPIASSLPGPITGAQWSVFTTVMSKEQAGIKEIAKALSISSSAATQIVNDLVEMNYLERRKNAADRRAVVITLSDEARRFGDEFRARMNAQMEPLFEILTMKELAELARINKKIVDGIQNQKT